MNSNWHYDLAMEHGDALRRHAHDAQLVREARASGGAARHGRTSFRRRRVILGALAAVAAAGASSSIAAVASPTPTPTPATATSTATWKPATPNSCVELNGGDYNACNVGNSRRGDLRYQVSRPRTPNECILLNGGDYAACNVGNAGRGDLPYRPVRP